MLDYSAYLRRVEPYSGGHIHWLRQRHDKKLTTDQWDKLVQTFRDFALSAMPLLL